MSTTSIDEVRPLQENFCNRLRKTWFPPYNWFALFKGGNDRFWKLETIKKLFKFIKVLFCGKVQLMTS